MLKEEVPLSAKAQVLVVEDERELSADIVELIKPICEPTVAFDGEQGEFLASQDVFDAIILDLMLPGESGLDLLMHIRHQNISTPVLILTAKDTIADKLRGFNDGADDYVTKPFHREELLARMKALLKRSGHLNSSDVIQLGDLVINTSKHLATYAGHPLTLKGREFDLLAYLAGNPGTIITKEQIFNRLWGFDSETSLSVVEVYMSNLRKELKNAGSALSIRTIRNAGYIVEAPDEQ
ncbi:DNA-binding response regulator [Levilactobacillus namurensis DSM 19117]|uniref:DNA-binding response regulator n=2 Tax=Levilactobacillus namurensis TaxID=380393 RepID=A0A0R1JUG1_9LACO|nr:DNA-binding response regulator [Levilactobacillus namurensis DSM 19117]